MGLRTLLKEGNQHLIEIVMSVSFDITFAAVPDMGGILSVVIRFLDSNYNCTWDRAWEGDEKANRIYTRFNCCQMLLVLPLPYTPMNWQHCHLHRHGIFTGNERSNADLIKFDSVESSRLVLMMPAIHKPRCDHKYLRANFSWERSANPPAP